MLRLRPLRLWLMTERHRRGLVGCLNDVDRACARSEAASDAVRGRQAEIIAAQNAVIARQKLLLAARDGDLAIVTARAAEANQLVAELTERLEHLGGRA